MSVQIKHYQNNQKLIFTITGEMLYSEFAHIIKDIAQKYSQLADHQDVIWDLSTLKIPDATFEVVEQLVEMFLTNNYFKCNAGRTGYIIDLSAEKHLLNYFVNSLENNGYERKLHLFHELEQAKRSLDFPETSSV